MEHVDFYRGRGPDSLYLGTIAAPDASPEALNLRARFSTDDAVDHPVKAADFHTRLAALFATAAEDDSRMTVVSSGKHWPHRYSNSLETPWTVCFDVGALWIHWYGYVVACIYCNGFREPSVFPRFTPTAAAAT